MRCVAQTLANVKYEENNRKGTGAMTSIVSDFERKEKKKINQLSLPFHSNESSLQSLMCWSDHYLTICATRVLLLLQRTCYAGSYFLKLCHFNFCQNLLNWSWCFTSKHICTKWMQTSHEGTRLNHTQFFRLPFCELSRRANDRPF